MSATTRVSTIAAVVLLFLLVPSAWAAEPKIEVHSLKFVGVQGISAAQLRDALATRESSHLPFFGRKHLFDRARLEADLERIRAYYVDHGFPDARVTSFDVQLDQKQTRVDLTIHVSEGEPLRVVTVNYEGFEAVPKRRMAFIRRRSAVKIGRPADRAAVTATHELLVNALRDNGYPFARVTIGQANGADGHQLTLTFTARPGVQAAYGPVQVVGTKTVSDWIVERELLFQEGDLYSRRTVQESQRKLYDLQLFEFVNVQTVRAAQRAETSGTQGASDGNPSESPATEAADAGAAEQPPQDVEPVPLIGSQTAPVKVPMRVTVTEGKHHRVQFSVGYGTEEKARGEVRYRQLNFFGGARTAEAHAKWSSLEKGVRLEFTQPFFFAPRWSFSVVGQRWYDDEPGYRATTSGGHATLAYKPGIETTYSLTLTDEYDQSRVTQSALSDPLFQKQLIGLGINPVTGSQDGTLVALALDFQRSTAFPNPLNASGGYVANVHYERAARLLRGSFAYSGASFDVRYYHRLSDRLVVANRLQAGTLDPATGQDSDIPFSRRYFLGGATSIRGWGRYEVSPLSDGGTPIGGFSMLQGTSELRFTIRGSLGAVAFLDFGNVWPGTWEVHGGDLRYAVGPGLRYSTPVGPIRLDFGYQLNPIAGLVVDGKPATRRWRIHFSIGQAF